jgi:RimJ/RimL family protein N-acetyltransferase
MITVRATREDDLDYIFEAEHNDENSRYIIPWSREKHIQALSNPDLMYFVVETREAFQQVGFVILAGLQNEHASIEFRRLVITEKGSGYGSQTLEIIKQLVFVQRRAHRLWLDVKVDNKRARQLYEKHGFTVEGVIRECLRTGDTYESLVLMSLLRHEYEAQA